MAAIRHLGFLKETLHTSGAHFLASRQDVLIGGGDMSRKLSSKNAFWRRNSTFLSISTRLFLKHLYLSYHTQFQPDDTYTGDHTPFTNSSSPFLSVGKVPTQKHSKWRNRSLLPTANLTADNCPSRSQVISEQTYIHRPTQRQTHEHSRQTRFSADHVWKIRLRKPARVSLSGHSEPTPNVCYK